MDIVLTDRSPVSLTGDVVPPPFNSRKQSFDAGPESGNGVGRAALGSWSDVGDQAGG